MSGPGAPARPPRPQRAQFDLRFHGDQDIADGLVDLAVNVRIPAPPAWLQAVINQTTPGLAGYPRSDEAARRSPPPTGWTLDQVLPTAGGAEAFTLLARALQPRRPVIIHPQFTEPEAALLAAGHQPERVILERATGFRLDPDLIPADADLIMIGNPTNPTSVLHPAALLRTLVRPGRVLVIDEAFMDAVPGEPETMISSDLRGVVVLRSLTKTWGLAGLRAGYAVGDAEVIAAMAAQQPPLVGLDARPWPRSRPVCPIRPATWPPQQPRRPPGTAGSWSPVWSRSAWRWPASRWLPSSWSTPSRSGATVPRLGPDRAA